MALKPPADGWGPLLERSLGSLGVAASAAARDALAVYLDQVTAWGARMDLTAARSAEELVDLSLADAAVLAREEEVCAQSGVRWGDVGSGAGAPGIPLFLLLGDRHSGLRGTLVEPRSKRVAFLRSCVGQLRLQGVDVVRCRSDALAEGTFTHAVARATLPPPEWLAEGARLASEAVWVLLAREPAPSQPGWSIDRDVAYCWPLTGVSRRALRYVPAR